MSRLTSQEISVGDQFTHTNPRTKATNVWKVTKVDQEGLIDLVCVEGPQRGSVLHATADRMLKDKHTKRKP